MTKQIIVWISFSVFAGCALKESPSGSEPLEGGRDDPHSTNEAEIRRGRFLFEGEPRELWYSVRGGKAFLNGDICLGDAAVVEARSAIPEDDRTPRASLLAVGGKTWPGGVVPYVIDSTFTTSERNDILDAMQDWRDKTPLDFVFRTNQQDYIRFVKITDNSTLSNSFVGRQGGEQPINLSSTFNGIQHEIGHAVGLFHEQSRQDRDNYLSIQWDNIASGYDINFELESSSTDFRTFDWDSIMLYDSFSYSYNWLPTMLRKNAWSLFSGSTGDPAFLRVDEPLSVTGIKFADFNGDGQDDAFRVASGKFYVAYSGQNTWLILNTSAPYSMGDIALGDFDGNGKADVFIATGTKWYISYDGNEPVVAIRTTSLRTSELGFADFNGDGKTDIFYGDGTRWLIYPGGNFTTQVLHPAQTQKVSPYLGFGDFNGDGYADVFYASLTGWRISYSGTGNFTLVNNYPYPLTMLRLGDINNDGLTDVLYVDNVASLWRSTGGTDELRHTGGQWPPANELVIANIDGSGDDILADGIFKGNEEISEGDAYAVSRLYWNSWEYSSAAESSWNLLRYSNADLADLGFADFDGNGITDVFYASGSRWYVSYNGTGDWVQAKISSLPRDRVRFGDFNNDGKDDIFFADGAQWYVVYGGPFFFQQVLSSKPQIVSSLGFGDFNGDGKADVFYPNGTMWYVSYGGTSSWTSLNTSATTIDKLDFGDFNGDGRTDVFYTNGSKWYVSYSGTTSWVILASSVYTQEDLALCDFDGDGVEDVFRANGSNWFVSYGGNDAFAIINSSSMPLDRLGFGDFDGDGSCDAFGIFSRLVN